MFVAFAFTGFSAETLIADVHDGDASAAEVQALGALMPTLDPGVHPTKAPTSVPEQPPSGHSAHACHCVHAHGGLPGLIEARPIAAAPAIHTRVVSDRMPSSVSQEPRIRPPEA